MAGTGGGTAVGKAAMVAGSGGAARQLSLRRWEMERERWWRTREGYGEGVGGWRMCGQRGMVRAGGSRGLAKAVADGEASVQWRGWLGSHRPKGAAVAGADGGQ